jgi:hypothetical protein
MQHEQHEAACYLHCKKAMSECAKFRCWQRWRRTKRRGSRNFPTPTSFGSRHRCPHRNFAKLFLQCTVLYSGVYHRITAYSDGVYYCAKCPQENFYKVCILIKEYEKILERKATFCLDRNTPNEFNKIFCWMAGVTSNFLASGCRPFLEPDFSIFLWRWHVAFPSQIFQYFLPCILFHFWYVQYIHLIVSITHKA